MSMTEICEHDRNLDNNEHECVELDGKNKKITTTTNVDV